MDFVFHYNLNWEQIRDCMMGEVENEQNAQMEIEFEHI